MAKTVFREVAVILSFDHKIIIRSQSKHLYQTNKKRASKYTWGLYLKSFY